MEVVCPPNDALRATQPPSPDCRRTPHDIFFVVDGSASIKSENFVHVRKFLMDLLMLLRVGISDIHIGLQQFSQVDKTEFLLNLDKYSAEEQMRVVDTMKYQMGRRTMTGDALTRVANKVFTGDPLDGDRPGVKDVLIIFTDGNAHDLRVALRQAEIINHVASAWSPSGPVSEGREEIRGRAETNVHESGGRFLDGRF
ncbi:cartilage matrix protein-like [Dendronephthya gigantea]|uniref:cartilage matrix protein-like n=1 Tax=Dendronephthya gigantea TaxID=151771 RepID=UPI00106C1CA3|nr:cartilage matrix protein-like [Dendronephthya gigantea]XP_028419266.1 cartilage matrix protein-like [Dendronephthya gigantea]